MITLRTLNGIEQLSTMKFQVSHVNELPVTAQDIAQATSKDLILASVYNYIMEGWPMEESIQPFYQRKGQLSTNQGCLL